MDALVGSFLIKATLPFTASLSTENKALVIAETRPLFFLPHVVSTAVRTHPGWHLYVFGTPAVHALLDSQCNNYADVTRVTLGTGARMSSREYSHLLLSERMWTVIREEHVLVFQADCVLVRGTPAKMLEYDFVGAVCGRMHPQHFVMNGGLSLRRRSAMLRAIDLIRTRHPEMLDEPEDVALCRVMRQYDFKLPTMEECNEFAIESVGDPRTAVGLHGTDKYYAPPELVANLLET